jgi:iron complex outermembrane recepter protein
MKKLALYIFTPAIVVPALFGLMTNEVFCSVALADQSPGSEQTDSKDTSQDKQDGKQTEVKKSEQKGQQLLKEIVVTASKTPQPQGSVTQQVDVITAEEIEQTVFANGNLAEIVSHEPGVFVGVLGRNQPNWGSVGGLGTNYNTYMLDGLPMDSFCDPMSIDPWIVERVEVQRGPASVLYPNFLSQDFSGNQSPLAGTTNFILKERVDKPGTRISGGYGSFNTESGRVEHKDRIGNLHYYLGGGLEYSEYTNNRYKLNTLPSGVDMTEDPDYFNKNIDFRSTYFFNNADNHKLSFFFHNMWHDGDMGRPNRDLNHHYFTSQAKYLTPVSDWGSAHVQLGYLLYDRNFGEDYYPTSLNKKGVSGADQEIIPADVSLAIKHSGSGLLTVGSDYQHADYQWFYGQSSSDLINDTTATQVGLYAQEEYQLGRWIFRVGGRYNSTWHDYDLLGGLVPAEDEKSWESPLWSAGVRYNATETFSVYANSGSSFLVPAAKFIGGTIRAVDEGKTGVSGTLPNLDLDAEEGWGSDLGVDFQATSKMKVGTRGFLNLVDDVVVTRQISLEPNQTQAINGGKSTAYGAELWLQYVINPFWSWYANYTYTHTNVENEISPDMNDVELSNYPQHMGNIGTSFNLPYEIKATAAWRLVGSTWNSTSKKSRIKLGSYDVVDLKLEKSLFATSGYQTKIFLNLHNITNDQYALSYYYQDPGFTAMTGIEVTF